MKLDDVKVRELKNEFDEKWVSMDFDRLLMESYGFVWISINLDGCSMDFDMYFVGFWMESYVYLMESYGFR